MDKSNFANQDSNSSARPANSKTISDDSNETLEDSHKVRLLNSLTARKNPFADLVRISLLLNPREYELPEDFIPNIQFPGTSKKYTVNSNSATRESRLTSYSVKRAQELDRNNLPLILRTCYFCRRGCRKAPLIHCDYCPLVYHADCIDPPLTILPNTRWMCPNHVEPVAEEKLLSSSSFCERVKLWNHFSQPVDHESIKISFLDRVHTSSSPEPESQLNKLSCIVPKRIKREYERFIVDIDEYDGNSDCDDSEPVHEQRKTNMGKSLDQILESSRILELQDKPQACGGVEQKNPGSHLIDKDAKEKEEWLEFIQKLASADGLSTNKETTNHHSNRPSSTPGKWSNNNNSLSKNHTLGNLVTKSSSKERQVK